MSLNTTIGRRTALAGAAALAGTRIARAQTPAEVKLAMLVPLSGPWARSGLLEQMGARMAVDDINNAGGIKALGGAKVKLLEFDAGESAEKAKDAAQRMVAQEPDLSGGFGCWLSTFTLAATEVTERAELPWLTLSYSDLSPIAATNTCSSAPPPPMRRRRNWSPSSWTSPRAPVASARPRSPSSVTTPPPPSASTRRSTRSWCRSRS